MHVCWGTQPSFHHSGSLYTHSIEKSTSTMFASYFTKATTFFPLADCDTGAICWPTKERLLVLSSLAMRTLVHRFSMMSMVAIITMLCISSSVSKYRPNLSEKKAPTSLGCNSNAALIQSVLQVICFWVMFHWTRQSNNRTMSHEISAPFTK